MVDDPNQLACADSEVICTKSFQDGHVRAFEYFGEVPTRIRNDNSKIAVAAIVRA